MSSLTSFGCTTIMKFNEITTKLVKTRWMIITKPSVTQLTVQKSTSLLKRDYENCSSVWNTAERAEFIYGLGLEIFKVLLETFNLLTIFTARHIFCHFSSWRTKFTLLLIIKKITFAIFLLLHLPQEKENNKKSDISFIIEIFLLDCFLLSVNI